MFLVGIFVLSTIRAKRRMSAGWKFRQRKGQSIFTVEKIGCDLHSTARKRLSMAQNLL